MQGWVADYLEYLADVVEYGVNLWAQNHRGVAVALVGVSPFLQVCHDGAQPDVGLELREQTHGAPWPWANVHAGIAF